MLDNWWASQKYLIISLVWEPAAFLPNQDKAKKSWSCWGIRKTGPMSLLSIWWWKVMGADPARPSQVQAIVRPGLECAESRWAQGTPGSASRAEAYQARPAVNGQAFWSQQRRHFLLHHAEPSPPPRHAVLHIWASLQHQREIWPWQQTGALYK